MFASSVSLWATIVNTDALCGNVLFTAFPPFFTSQEISHTTHKFEQYSSRHGSGANVSVSLMSSLFVLEPGGYGQRVELSLWNSVVIESCNTNSASESLRMVWLPCHRNVTVWGRAIISSFEVRNWKHSKFWEAATVEKKSV